MTKPITRQQRRAMARHIADNETTVEADRKFFERRPNRVYRVRRMSRAEMGQWETALDDQLVITTEFSAFTVVKNFAPGVRMRIFVPGPPDEDGNETSDDLGRFLWERHSKACPWVAEKEARLQAAIRLPGGPLAGQNQEPDAA
ncbi:hypothetical protein MKK63_21080 [Methylobacterium sp. J-088]|uniref:hypothetical protein n=1 Tax=Methylobacterium sp. J-088 TaxID=2836664 RepID=UPI001FBAB6CB|nr:hypothetical protein [Methylobacterium sp. J-088]MCJ2065188.1 hypothetical protein [Methylobacterium sp. J-088]